MDTLYGRDAQLATARGWLDRALGGQGKLLLFTGEPGIGKSRLMEQLAREAAARGAVVAWGRSWEAGGAPAYWPWTQVFRSLGESGDPFASVTGALAVGQAEARFAAFDHAVQRLTSLAARAPLLIVLDDLHAADAPSLLLLLLLARELSRVPLLVTGAYRDAEVRTASELAPLLSKLAREAEVTPLSRLEREHVSAWLREVAPEVDAARAEELYRWTEGQPLFVTEALRLGVATGASWTQGPHAVLDERLGRLSAQTRAVLEGAAVLGREFSRDEAAVIAHTSRDDVHEALREALTASIISRARGVTTKRARACARSICRKQGSPANACGSFTLQPKLACCSATQRSRRSCIRTPSARPIARFGRSGRAPSWDLPPARSAISRCS